MDKMTVREKLLKKVRDDISLLDCQGDCPDEVAIAEETGGEIRTDTYCENCFTNQLLSLLSAEIAALKNPYTKKFQTAYGSEIDQQLDRESGFESCRTAVLDLLKAKPEKSTDGKKNGGEKC